MGVFSSILASLFISATMQGAEEVNEVQAKPIERIVPDYPEACVTFDRKAVGSIDVLFDVTKDGITENVRIAESSDVCFNDIVVAAARNWIYEPHKVDGRARAQIDTETTFTFIFGGETQAVDFDAQPRYRVPPRYPNRCQRRAAGYEYVDIQFDVSAEGVAENIQIVETSNKCFNSNAIKSVKKWRYHPKTVSGIPVIRIGVTTTIDFRLARGYRPRAEEMSETPAEPIRRTAPHYPSVCTPPEGVMGEPQIIVLMFDVTKDGITENVRVVDATDACFNEAAIAAIRNWDYTPRRVNGAPRSQEDLEVSFTFVFEEETNAEDFDARPLLRVPPRYPEGCQSRAADYEYITVQFDISAEGMPENIMVIEVSNECFIKAAKQSVKKWRYRPKTIAGEPAVRKDAVTTIEFQLARGYRPPEHKYRNALKKRLRNVRRSVRRGEDPQESILKLKETEEEFGDNFSTVEIAQFYYLRAVVRIAAGDSAGALDDMRVVQSSGMAGDAAKIVGETIAQLEAALAAKQSDAQQAEDDGESPE